MAPDCQVPFNWPYANLPNELHIRPAGDWLWSGSFRIDEAGDFGLRVLRAPNKSGEKRTGLEWRILPVNISLGESSIFIVFDKEKQAPPYRIENKS